MSIPAPNYTQIPNIIFDYWMAVLKPAAFIILVCMCRKIYGWHKTSDRISKAQLIKVTGLSKNTIADAIKELERHGLLIVQQEKTEYGFQANTYFLNVNKPIDELYSDQNLDRGGSSPDPGVGQTLTQGVGQTLTPQKKDSTKEKLTKENRPDNQKLVSDHHPQGIHFSFEEQKFKGISDTDLQKWKEAYPNTNINQQISKIEDWVMGNPKKFNKRINMRSFISRWLSKADDRALNESARSYQSKGTKKTVSEQAENNYKLYLECLEAIPKLSSFLKVYGKVNVVNTKTNNDLSFDINPDVFEGAFYKLAGLSCDS